MKANQTEDGCGWIEIFDKGMLVTLRGKTGWREVGVGHGSSDAWVIWSTSHMAKVPDRRPSWRSNDLRSRLLVSLSKRSQLLVAIDVVVDQQSVTWHLSENSGS